MSSVPPPGLVLRMWTPPNFNPSEYVTTWADMRGRDDLEKWEVLTWSWQWVNLAEQIDRNNPEPPLEYPIRVRLVRPREN